jgi:hypothetical protein
MLHYIAIYDHIYYSAFLLNRLLRARVFVCDVNVCGHT